MQSFLFDMDGTLLDSMDEWYGLKNNLVNIYNSRSGRNIGLTAEQREKIEKKRLRSAISFINAQFGADLDYEKDCFAYMRDFYLNRCQIKEGVPEALEEFHKKGIKMAVCTATPRKLAKEALRQKGLDKYFKFIISPSRIMPGKRHFPIFVVSCLLLLKAPKNVVLFDDAAYALNTAKRMGIRCVGLKDDVTDARHPARDISDIYFESFIPLLEHYKREEKF